MIDKREEHEKEAKDLNLPSRGHLPEDIKKYLYNFDRLLEREIAKLMDRRDQQLLRLLKEYYASGERLSSDEIPPAT